MKIMTLLAHWVMRQASKAATKRFTQQTGQLEHVQRQKLATLLAMVEKKKLSYEEFCRRYPLTRYADWRGKIETSRRLGINIMGQSKIVRFQPTSGSSEALKFIPYTPMFLKELDQAIGLWLNRLYHQHPRLARATHYWSISWLPESQRRVLKNANLNDDSALLSFSKRLMSRMTQAVPNEVAYAETAEAAMFATAVYLVADANLGMISVWSPTFALQLIEIIESQQVQIAEVLSTGQWQQPGLSHLKAPKAPRRARVLKQLDFQQQHVWQKLWPKLCLISSWDTASAEQWAQELRAKMPKINFEAKGLWATEGVVTIPYGNCFPLMYQSHFYEFLKADGKTVLAAWQLQQGDVVSPVISTGSGLMRYVIDDEIEVTGFLNQVPCFKFLGRKLTVDMVGEKLDHQTAVQILQQFQHQDYRPMSLIGVERAKGKKPHYILLSDGDNAKQPSAAQLERLLKQNFHYELARDLGQLDPAQVLHVEDAWDYYKRLAMHNGMIEGNIKPEPLKKIKTNLEVV
ncbi:GH3 auxin-responsive promoter [Acinetobacter calcoaceticus]|uniref:GH3 auxin-responsive promoter n=1 Tax=Acinetobacter calcoaceticus TaxID=471 RepID=A0A4R1XA30_ACICA|nr:GH3 auxin-responsive promoter [Acinetobacter calcoaceticus]